MEAGQSRPGVDLPHMDYPIYGASQHVSTIRGKANAANLQQNRDVKFYANIAITQKAWPSNRCELDLDSTQKNWINSNVNPRDCHITYKLFPKPVKMNDYSYIITSPNTNLLISMIILL